MSVSFFTLAPLPAATRRWVAVLAALAAFSTSAQSPANPPPERVSAATVALVLPAQTTQFARAAEVVRQGVFAAHKAAPGGEVVLQVIEIDDRPTQVATALKRAKDRGAAVVLGPLTRAQVAAAVQVPTDLPVVTLSQPEQDANAAPALLAFGLTIEQEARVLVQAALRRFAPAPPAGAKPRSTPRFVVLVGEGPLSRRAGVALRNDLAAVGERATVIPFAARYESLVEVGEKIGAVAPDLVFLALDANESAMLRPRLPRELPLLATSQVNLGGPEGELLARDLEGVVFVDVPWLLEPDHPAVMVYPRPEQALSAELQRLYALGIDGYRLAVEWIKGASQFTLDGVTGTLVVDRARSARTERWPSFAVFRDGKIERIEVVR